MSNIDKQAVTEKTKELSSLMVERFSMNPVSCKLLNEAWKKNFLMKWLSLIECWRYWMIGKPKTSGSLSWRLGR